MPQILSVCVRSAGGWWRFALRASDVTDMQRLCTLCWVPRGVFEHLDLPSSQIRSVCVRSAGRHGRAYGWGGAVVTDTQRLCTLCWLLEALAGIAGDAASQIRSVCVRSAGEGRIASDGDLRRRHRYAASVYALLEALPGYTHRHRYAASVYALLVVVRPGIRPKGLLSQIRSVCVRSAGATYVCYWGRKTCASRFERLPTKVGPGSRESCMDAQRVVKDRLTTASESGTE